MLFVVLLSVVLLSVVLLSVSVVLLSVVPLSVVLLSVVPLSVVLLSIVLRTVPPESHKINVNFIIQLRNTNIHNNYIVQHELLQYLQLGLPRESLMSCRDQHPLHSQLPLETHTPPVW